MADKSTHETTCLSCKIVSISCLVGIGCYMFKLGAVNKSRITYNSIGAACIGLGIGEIFDVSPFRSGTTQNTQK